MERIYVAEWSIDGRTRTMTMETTDGRAVTVPLERSLGYMNLGHLMAAVSAAAKGLAGWPSDTAVQESETVLDRVAIEPLTVAPYAFRLVLEAGPYQFTCHLDRDLEHVLAGCGAALRFFALKRGLVVLEDEVTRNAERAHEAGLWTAPEGTA